MLRSIVDSVRRGKAKMAERDSLVKARFNAEKAKVVGANRAKQAEIRRRLQRLRKEEKRQEDAEHHAFEEKNETVNQRLDAHHAKVGTQLLLLLSLSFVAFPRC